MSQLVGLPCAVCTGRIDTVIDGRFCSSCGCAVHVRCVKPYQRGPQSCAACGASPEEGIAARQAQVQDERSAQHVFRRHRVTWGILEILGGLACVAFSPLILLSPVFWWLGAMVIASGFSLMAHGIVLLWRTEPRARNDDTP